jgi:hypothetical protein
MGGHSQAWSCSIRTRGLTSRDSRTPTLLSGLGLSSAPGPLGQEPTGLRARAAHTPALLFSYFLCLFIICLCFSSSCFRCSILLLLAFTLFRFSSRHPPLYPSIALGRFLRFYLSLSITKNAVFCHVRPCDC